MSITFARNCVGNCRSLWRSLRLRSQPHGLPTKPLTMCLRSILAPFLPDTNLDLVVTIGAPAANFFLKVRQQIFPTVPMIFTGVEKRRVSLSDLTTNDAVVPSTVDHVGIIDHILRLLPATDHVAVVIGNSPNEKFWVESISNELKPFTGRVTFTWLNELPFEDMLKRVAALPPRSAILFIYVSVDAAGVSLEGEERGEPAARRRQRPHILLD